MNVVEYVSKVCTLSQSLASRRLARGGSLVVVALLGCTREAPGSVVLTQESYSVQAGEAVPITVALSGRLKRAEWQVLDAPRCRGQIRKLGQASAEFKAPSECSSEAANTVQLQAEFETGAPVTLTAKVTVMPRPVAAPRPAVAAKQPPSVTGVPDLVSAFDAEDVRDFPAKGFVAEHTIRTDSVDIYLKNASDAGWGVVCVENKKASVDLSKFKTMTVELGPGERAATGKGKLEVKLERPEALAEYGGKIVRELQLPLERREQYHLDLTEVDAPLLLDTRRICVASAADKLEGDAAIRLFGVTFQ